MDLRADRASVSVFVIVVMKSKMAERTIRKSITFHGSRRYVNFPNTKPFVKILRMASMMKTIEKPMSK